MIFLENITDERLSHIKRLGYFLGSFDPLHLGHIETLKIILNRKFCDAVLVYCVRGKSSWKQRSNFFKRTRFCENALCEMEGIILSYLSPLKIQQKLTVRTKNTVKSKFFPITGIIGADIAYDLERENKNPAVEKLRQLRQKDFMRGVPLSADFNDSVSCSIAIPVDDFIVALREGYRYEDIPPNICGRKIRAIVDTNEYRGLSSSAIRKRTIIS